MGMMESLSVRALGEENTEALFYMIEYSIKLIKSVVFHGKEQMSVESVTKFCLENSRMKSVGDRNYQLQAVLTSFLRHCI